MTGDALFAVLPYVGAFLAGGLLGLLGMAWLNAHSYDRGYREGTAHAVARCREIAAEYGNDVAELLGRLRPVPMSDDVQAEQRRRAA